MDNSLHLIGTATRVVASWQQRSRSSASWIRHEDRPPAQALIMSLSNYRRALAGYGTSSPDPRGNWARTCSTSGPGDTYFPDIAEHGELSAWIEVKWKKSHTRSSPRDHATPHSYLRTRRSARPQTVSSLDRHLFSAQSDSWWRDSSGNPVRGRPAGGTEPSMTECPENASNTIRYDVT